MKFLKYLVEDAQTAETICKILEKDCIKFIEELRGDFLYRGTHNDVNNIKRFTSRIISGRIPKDTYKDIHNALNKEFKSQFGWNVRDGVFTSFDIPTVREYGKPHLFFPIGDYKYCYSPDVEDFYINVHNDILYEVKHKVYDIYDKIYGYDKNKGKWEFKTFYEYTTDSSISFKTVKEIAKKYNLDYSKLYSNMTGNPISGIPYTIYLSDDYKEHLINNFPEFSEKKGDFMFIWKTDKLFSNFMDDYLLKNDVYDFRKLISTYTNKNIKRLYNQKNEISFNCDSYYLIDRGFTDVIENYFEDKI